MSVAITSWNVQELTGQPERMPGVMSEIQGLDTDVIVLQEAFTEETPTSDVLALRTNLQGMGYVSTIDVLYDDDDGRLDRHGMIMASRVEASLSQVRLAGRNAIKACLQDEESRHPITVVGAHFDDRHEQTRQEQAFAAVVLLASAERACIVGDLNALHEESKQARVLRSISSMVRHLPYTNPYPGQPMSLQRVGSIAQRLCGMADGGTIQILRDGGYRDADKNRQATWRGVAQIDHIMHNNKLVATSFELGAAGLSDHRPVTARLVAV